jgi:hypothetical protein
VCVLARTLGVAQGGEAPGPAGVHADAFTGGHTVMYDFPDSEGLQRITRELLRTWRRRALGLPRVPRAAQHTTVRRHVIAGKTITGFAWREVLARVDKLVPYHAEQWAKARGVV